jgi:hypothetical protein
MVIVFGDDRHKVISVVTFSLYLHASPKGG